MKKKTKVIKAWAVLCKDEGEIGFVEDVSYYIYPEEAKVYARKFSEARNTILPRSTKVVSVKIVY